MSLPVISMRTIGDLISKLERAVPGILQTSEAEVATGHEMNHSEQTATIHFTSTPIEHGNTTQVVISIGTSDQRCPANR